MRTWDDKLPQNLRIDATTHGAFMVDFSVDASTDAAVVHPISLPLVLHQRDTLDAKGSACTPIIVLPYSNPLSWGCLLVLPVLPSLGADSQTESLACLFVHSGHYQKHMSKQ